MLIGNVVQTGDEFTSYIFEAGVSVTPQKVISHSDEFSAYKVMRTIYPSVTFVSREKMLETVDIAIRNSMVEVN